MKKGKASESILKRSVFKYISTSETVRKGAAIGSDCAFLGWKDADGLEDKEQTLAVSTQTVTFPITDAAGLAVYAAVNNLAAGGAEAKAITLAVTLPEEAEEVRLKALMKQAEDACKLLHVSIAGGHTETVPQVRSAIVTATAIGTPLPQKLFQRSKEGLDVVMTKWAGLEGTMILAREKEEELLTRYPVGLISAAKEFEEYLPVISEAATALKSGVYTMHDARSGGVFGALWELSKSMGVGLTIDLKKIPVKQETIEICEFFELNPYELLSGGSLLMAVTEGEQLVEKLEKEGIPAAVIGKTTDGNDKVLINEDEIRFLEPAKSDELYKILF